MENEKRMYLRTLLLTKEEELKKNGKKENDREVELVQDLIYDTMW